MRYCVVQLLIVKGGGVDRLQANNVEDSWTMVLEQVRGSIYGFLAQLSAQWLVVLTGSLVEIFTQIQWLKVTVNPLLFFFLEIS